MVSVVLLFICTVLMSKTIVTEKLENVTCACVFFPLYQLYHHLGIAQHLEAGVLRKVMG